MLLWDSEERSFVSSFMRLADLREEINSRTSCVILGRCRNRNARNVQDWVPQKEWRPMWNFLSSDPCSHVVNCMIFLEPR